ncbi:hypothetical protein [Cohnella cellulosilytica]|uniref:Uncharacterized protein n=1 Tax=Cohnella cellulosilytica TaxID=986710 RepID=A0ABW2F761_9BACL
MAKNKKQKLGNSNAYQEEFAAEQNETNSAANAKAPQKNASKR